MKSLVKEFKNSCRWNWPLSLIALATVLNSIAVLWMAHANSSRDERIKGLEQRKNGVWLDFNGPPGPFKIDGRVLDQ